MDSDININKKLNVIDKKIADLKNNLFELVVPESPAHTASSLNTADQVQGVYNKNNNKIIVTAEALNNKVTNCSLITCAKSNKNVEDPLLTTSPLLNNSLDLDLNLEMDSDLVLSNSNVKKNKEIDPVRKIALTKVRNFLEYPDKQEYCPNIENSKSSFWVQLPEDYAGDYYCKFCCTSCYTVISEAIYCGENQSGDYILDNFSVNDMASLKELYDNEVVVNNNKGYEFPEASLNTLLGKAVLKHKIGENEYITIQVVKTLDELYSHEDEPSISKELYKRHYKCPVKASKPVITIMKN